MKKLILRINGKSLNLFLKETETAEKIYNAVPINSSINTWGEEIYFNTNLSINREKEAKAVVDFGEIAFWTEGSAIAIGYGKTPVSSGDEIRLASPCNIWANADFDKSFFGDINDGDKVSLDKS
tara:strand:- start:786 stop:1157 length:372 start_codon:yes stop_codon:yes gene_type:complete